MSSFRDVRRGALQRERADRNIAHRQLQWLELRRITLFYFHSPPGGEGLQRLTVVKRLVSMPSPHPRSPRYVCRGSVDRTKISSLPRRRVGAGDSQIGKRRADSLIRTWSRWCALCCAVRMDGPSKSNPMPRAFNGETLVKVILIAGPLCQAHFVKAPGCAWNTLDA